MKRKSIICLIMALIITGAFTFNFTNITAKPKAPKVTAKRLGPHKEKSGYWYDVKFSWTKTKGARYDVLIWTSDKTYHQTWPGYKETVITVPFKKTKKTYYVKCKVRALKNGTGPYSKTKKVSIPKK